MNEQDEAKAVRAMVQKISALADRDMPPDLWLAALGKTLALACLPLLSGVLTGTQVVEFSNKLACAFGETAKFELLKIKKMMAELN